MIAKVNRTHLSSCALVLLAAVACSDSSDEGSNGNGGEGGLGGSQSGAGGTDSSGAGQNVGGTSGASGNTAGGEGGTAGMDSGGTSNGGGSGEGGSGGDTGGAGGDGGSGGANDYPPAPREIVIDPGYGDQTIEFSAEDADANASSYHDDQMAGFNANAPTIQKKLMVAMGGINGAAHTGGTTQWAKQRGYHVLAVDMWNQNDGGQGTGYLETWSGEDKSPDVNVPPVNSVMHRVESALIYLRDNNAGADWGYYLDGDDHVRWNDVIIFGYSYGGQTAVAASKYVAAHRIIATSAPNLDAEAEWLTAMPSVTPVERCYMICGLEEPNCNNGKFTGAAEVLGWPGEIVNASQSTPPYNGSSRLTVDFGHSEFCSVPVEPFDEMCEFAFGMQ